MQLKDGVPIVPVWPNFDPGQYPPKTGPTFFLTRIDPNAGRPPRISMWSIGLQREIFKNLVVEASYVGNRGVWWSSSSMIDMNRITPQILAKNGLDLNKSEDRTLLTSRLDSPLAAQRGFNKPPYAGFPTSLTVSQSLRPFPMYTAINTLWAPLGNTWYDSLQAKVTKRYSKGLDFTTAFSWQKELTVGAETEDPAFAFVTPSINDVLNRPMNKYISGFSQPLRVVIAANYTFPTLNTNKLVSYAVRNWTFGTVLQYASGRPIRVPYASNNQLQAQLSICTSVNVFGGCTGTGTFANRVAGEPLFTQDLNSKFDPNKTFVLNPKAWTDPAPGQFSTSAAYYSDYRYMRLPSESMSLGRIFRFSERASLHIRIEFNNIFNRTYRNNPTASNAGQLQLFNAAGKPTSGFGYIDTGSVQAQPRNGQLVARFQF